MADGPAQRNQTIPLKTATATATYNPIIEWDRLAKIAAIMAMVATARAATRMLVRRGARSTRQLRKVDRLTLRANIRRAPFNRLVMTAMARPRTPGTTAATTAMVPAAARPSEIVART